MRTFAMRFWPVLNVWFLANVRMRTIVSDWKQPIRKQLYETKRQRRHALSKGDRVHWLNKQSKFVRISLKCVLNSQAFWIRNSQVASVLRIAIEVEMGLQTSPIFFNLVSFWSSKCVFYGNVKQAKIFCLFRTVFRPFHNGTFRKNSCLQKPIVELKLKTKKVCFAMLFKIISTIRNAYLTSSYQRAGANSNPKIFYDYFHFTSF